MPGAGERARRPVEDDPAAHEHEPLDDVLDRAELVRDVERSSRHARACRRASSAASASCGVGVDARGRLVEDEERRLAGERLRDERPLLLAARELGERRVGVLRQPDVGDRLVDDRAVRAPQRARAARRCASRPAETTSRTVTGASVPSRRAARGSRASPAGEAVRRLAEEERLAGGRTLKPERERAAASSCRRRSARRSRRTRPPRPRGRRPSSTGWPAVVGERDVAQLERLAAPERLPQRRQVGPHEREVVLAARRLVLRQPLDRVERPSRPRPRARPSRRPPARASGSTKTVVTPCSSMSSATRSRSRGAASASGESRAIGTCSRPYAVGEVAERLVRGHELAPLAVGEARRGTRRRALAAGDGERPGRGLAPASATATRRARCGEAPGIEPDVRIVRVRRAELRPSSASTPRLPVRGSSTAGWNPPPR